MRFKANDLETIAEKLDISPTMYEYAVARYQGISRYLADNGIDADFYPQGSFRTGTVVRPIKDGIETDFDIDVICELSDKKEATTPRQTKITIGEVLEKNTVYKEKLQPEEDRCWTLKYSGVSDGIGFSLDIVPSVGESITTIASLKSSGVQPQYAGTALAITEKHGAENYSWLPSNPKGFGNWFDQINKPFHDYQFESRRKAFFESNRGQFRDDAVVETVPDYHVKSSLQRSIQLLKRHRDQFYTRIENGKNLRPASVIVTSLAARVAYGASPALGLDGLLMHIAHGLKDYSSLLQGKTPAARFDGEQRTIIQKKSGKWYIPNPVNPNDNYADAWTDETAKMFFKWIDVVVKDLVDATPMNERQYIADIQRSFGTKFVNSALSLSDSATRSTSPVTTPTRPWGKP